MAGRTRKGFTLLELLVVIAIIVLLVALLAPNLRGMRRAANTVLCANNLKRIGEAAGLRQVHELSGNIAELRAPAWQSMLAPYVGYEGDIFICPEYDGDDGLTQTTPITELVQMYTSGAGGHYVEMDENPYMVKLSQSGYAQARADGWIDNDGSANNFPRENYPFDAAEAEADGVYYLCFEDYGGDQDFKDVVTRVTDMGDGTTELYMVSGYTAHANSLRDKQTSEILVSTGSNMGNLGPPLSGGIPWLLDTGAMETSYGMNWKVASIRSEPGKILALDYRWVVARTDHDWADYDSDGDGLPDFARHWGKINVLFTGGDVKLMEPDDINPDDIHTQAAYWDH